MAVHGVAGHVVQRRRDGGRGRRGRSMCLCGPLGKACRVYRCPAARRPGGAVGNRDTVSFTVNAVRPGQTRWSAERWRDAPCRDSNQIVGGIRPNARSSSGARRRWRRFGRDGTSRDALGRSQTGPAGTALTGAVRTDLTRSATTEPSLAAT